MKSVLFTLAVFMLFAKLVSGHWYVKKCANKTGNCRNKCDTGEMQTKPTSGMCTKLKLCCVPIGNNSCSFVCGETKSTKAPGTVTPGTDAASRTFQPLTPDLGNLVY
ncbi:PREDICTED: beta-defensin 126 [Galeopterus variegatus]|uniref:Beta-defensin n=1 Tax=Galeopterus variegatus TaxID=482537 RepID=A0ABM0RJW0_GALVR|nr:PREDICTED: beta-defensin 126 [Galeopterus variegatus]